MQSTYQQIIDDVLDDINEPDKLASLADEKIQVWINKWQHLVSLVCKVMGEDELQLQVDEVKYSLNFIPDVIKALSYIRREPSEKNNFDETKIEIVDLEYLLDKESYDNERFIIPYPDQKPTLAALWAQDGENFLRVYPAPKQEETLTISYQLTVDPRKHNNEVLTKRIVVPTEYEEPIKYGVKADIYKSVLKDEKNFQQMMTMYEACVGKVKVVPAGRPRMFVVNN